MTLGLGVQMARNAPVAPLDAVLEYRNELVIHSFAKKFIISKDEADRIFTEMLRWLWYMASTEQNDENPEAHQIDDPLLIIDEMWHEFILVTWDYAQFCQKMFGRYMHHKPDSGYHQQPVLKRPGDIKRALAARLGRKRAKYEGIHNWLGKDVFITWYLEFPQTYSPGAISSFRRGYGDLREQETPGSFCLMDHHNLADAENQKDELIEHALFMNIIRSLHSGT